MRIPFTLILIFFLVSVNSIAQSKSELTIQRLTNTKLIESCKNLREQVINEVKICKQNQSLLSPSEYQELMNGYANLQSSYNGFLEKLKMDMLDSQKRKFILKYPEDYAKVWCADLDNLKKMHDQNFKMPMNRILGLQGFSPWIPIAFEIIKETITLIRTLKADIKSLDEYNMNLYFTTPLKMPSWNDIK